MLNASHYENSRSDGVSVLEIVGGEGNERQFVPLLRSDLRGSITGPVTGLRLSQVFGFTAEQCDRVIEAAYRFPLPGDAAVLAVLVRFGNVTIRAALKERRQAEEEYAEAKRGGRQAALAARESPNVFTLLVAGIEPGQEVTVETLYVQLARPEGSGWSLRIPLTTAPRYVREDEQASRHSQGQPFALLRDPGHRFALDLRIHGAGAVASDTHALSVVNDGASSSVRLRDGAVIPDRDCVLRWVPSTAAERPALTVFTHDEPGSSYTYFLALAAPPSERGGGSRVPREIVLLVDHSGSMDGAKWDAADWAVERFLGDLSEHDRFALGLFHSTTRWFDRAPRPAQGDAVPSAVRFLKRHTDTGGTELGVALEQALRLSRGDGESGRHILVITDAQVSDDARILRLVDQEASRSDRRRVSILCIDAAPNSALAVELAERGGGVARFVTSDPREDDVTTALDEILADWSAPVVTGLRLHVDHPGAEAAGRSVCYADAGSSIDLGDLPAGRPVWVVGRVPSAAAGARFRLIAQRNGEVANCGAAMAREAGFGPALKALFGARRVLALEHLMHGHFQADELEPALRRLGLDPATALRPSRGEARSVYAENDRRSIETALRDCLVREALEFGLASAETAFVATREEPGRPVEECVVVANALAAGWSGNFLMAQYVRAGGAPPSLGLGRSTSGPMAKRAAPPPATPLAGPFDDHDLVVDELASSSECFAMDAAEAPPVAPSSPIRRSDLTVVFAGVAAFSNGTAVLFDSEQQPGTLPASVTLARLVLRHPDDPTVAIDPGLSLAVYVDDLATPRARVRLSDLARLGGERPLNLVRMPGQVVRVVLCDPSGSWSTGGPRLEVSLGW